MPRGVSRILVLMERHNGSRKGEKMTAGYSIILEILEQTGRFVGISSTSELVFTVVLAIVTAILVSVRWKLAFKLAMISLLALVITFVGFALVVAPTV